MSENLALGGVAKQSSTKYSALAGRANDGNVDGYFSRDSVTHTGGHGYEDKNPWWQVRLSSEKKIGGIRVWNRELQQSRDEIQVITVVAPNKDPLGNYELFMEYSGKNYTSSSILVAAEAINKDGGSLSMQSSIESMNPMLGTVSVTRTPTTNWGGGYQGYRYTVTFTGHPGDVPKLKVKSTNFTLTPDALVDVSVVREGVDNSNYNYKGEMEGEEYVNELFPFWVMIFNSSVPNPEELDASLGVRGLLKYACWFQEITSGGRVINLAPGGVEGQIVRVMLENDNYLSLAEVQVYESELNTMSQYKGSSVIAEKPLIQPYIGEESLDTKFKNVMYGGLWTLEIRDLVKYNNDRLSGIFKENNGFGKIGDWILMVTDQVGEVHRYYSDQVAEVVTLPKYGTLSYLKAEKNEEGYSMYNGVKGENIETEKGMGRKLAPCYGVDTAGLNGVESVGNHRYCPLNFGVGGLQSTQKTGAKATQNLIMNERVVVYTPFEDFLGFDHFTYRNYVNGVPGEIYEVRVNVKNCRRYEKEESKGTESVVHELCACERTESELFGGELSCPLAIQSTCEATSTSEEVYPFMCRMCREEKASLFSTECNVQVEKAVAYLKSKGLCDKTVPAGGYPSCREEGTTNGVGREPFMMYGVGEKYYVGGRGFGGVKMKSEGVN